MAGCGCDLNFGRSGTYAPAPPMPDLSDPPARVARLSFVEGAVSFRPAGSSVWTPAVLNRPITSGDELWTDAGARAEVHLGFAAIRLDAKTDFGLLELSDNAFQAKLTEGVIGIKVRRLEHGDAFEIDTPNASVTPSDAGEYRIEVRPQTNSTEIVARTGAMEVTNPQRAFEIFSGQRADVNPARWTEREISSAPAPDAFDRFCQLRDRRQEGSKSEKNVASGVLGAYDLDGCGVWRTNPEWGAYWTPRTLDPKWAPYRFGRWAWIERWGWTWVDDAPWGFAPFHYGRWAWLESGWAWIPGKSHAAPAFAPALVVFAGDGRPGSNFSSWIGKAGVAWFPLAPQEVYVPPYRASPLHLAELNAAIENPRANDPAAMARQSYANRLAPDAITAVSREVFTSGQPVGSSAIRVDASDAAAVKALGAIPSIAPTLASLSAPAPRGVQVLEPPAQNAVRQVVLRRSPAAAPVPFELRRPLQPAGEERER